MKTTRCFDTCCKARVVFVCVSLGIKTHARNEFSHFLFPIKRMTY